MRFKSNDIILSKIENKQLQALKDSANSLDEYLDAFTEYSGKKGLEIIFTSFGIMAISSKGESTRITTLSSGQQAILVMMLTVG